MVSRPRQEADSSLRTVKQSHRIAYLTCLIIALGLTALYTFQGFYPDFMYTFTNILSPVIAAMAVLSSFFALRRYWDNIGSRLSKIWLCFTLGMLLWFLGEFGWAVYTLVLNVEIPYPSIADVFWLSGYLPLFIALLLYVQLFQPAISSKMFLGSGVIVAGVSAATFPPLIMPILANASQQDLLILGINLAYPFLDLALFLEAIIGLLVFTVTRVKSSVGVAWRFMNVAILLNVVADITFSYTNMDGTYYNGHPLELLFHFGYLLFALAFYVHAREL